MDGSVSGAAASSSEGQDQIADAVQQTTGFTPAAEPADAPLREDHIQNAVAFLAHPKVRGSPQDSKRSFLEKKGLTPQEIAEAFKRVPETPSATVPAASSGLPAHAAAGPPKPYPTATADAMQQLQPAPIQQPQPQPIRWTQVVIGTGLLAAVSYAVKQYVAFKVVIGVGLLAAVSYAVKQYVAPKVSQWYHEWRHDADKSKAEEEQQKTAQLVASAIQAQTAEMQKTLDSLKDALTTLEKGKGPAEAARDAITLTDLRSELRALASSLNEFSSPAKASATGEGEGEKLEEIRALMSTMVQQMQELPDAIKPSVTSGPAFGGQHNQSAFVPHAAHALPNGEPLEASALSNGDTPSQPPHPASYMEVLEMLEKGETPPNIRTDIVDEPPNPAAIPSSARMKPKAKPWERAAAPISSAPFPALAPSGSSGIPSGSAFPPASRAALSPREPLVEGVGESSSNSLPTGLPAGLNAARSGTNIPRVTELSPGVPHDAGSSSSSPAGTWKPPAVPQPSIPRPAEIAAAAKSLLGASSQQPADNEAALENGGAEELEEAGASSSAGAGAAPEAEAASSA